MLCTKCGNQNATGKVCKVCGSPLLSRLADDPVEKKKPTKTNASGVIDIVDASQFEKDEKADKKKKKKEKTPVADIPILGETTNQDDDDQEEVEETDNKEDNKEDDSNKKDDTPKEVKKEKEEVKKDDNLTEDEKEVSNGLVTPSGVVDSNQIPVDKMHDNLPIEETNPSLETVIPGATQEVKVLDPLTNNNSSPISLSNIVANNSDINNFSVPADFRFTDEVVEDDKEEVPMDRVQEIKQQVSNQIVRRAPLKKNKKRIMRRIRRIIYKVIGFIAIIILIYYFISKYLFPHAYIFNLFK